MGCFRCVDLLFLNLNNIQLREQRLSILNYNDKIRVLKTVMYA